MRWVIALLALAGLGAAPGPRAPYYALLIVDGMVVNGTGAPGSVADVAIVGDRIAAIGPHLPRAAAARVIEARGRVVAPGFIDPHAHITDIPHYPEAENFLRQGVTTIVNSLHSIDQPYPLGAFLDRLQVAPNTVWTAGHSWARKRVMGLVDRDPTPTELATMQRLVREAVCDGAVGLATGLEYIPARYSHTPELIAVARAARAPNAVYVTHLRDEGPELLPAIDEALLIGRSAGLPVRINHLKSTGIANWGRSAAILDRIDRARHAGQQVSFDLYPYTAYSTYSDVLFPGWALAGGTTAFRQRIADPVQRRRLLDEMLTIFANVTAGRPASVQFRDVPGFAGKTLADLLVARGLPVTIDAGLPVLVDLQAQGGFTMIVEAMSEDDIRAFLRHPMASITTDGDLVKPGEGFPHPRSYGAMPRVLARYVREQHVLSLEEAVRRMTSLPARTYHLADRGILRAGAFADVVVFNPATIRDRATYTDPHRYAEGVETLIINGAPVLDSGRLTGARPGRPLRRTDAGTR